MRCNSVMKLEEIRAELTALATKTWGEERLPEQRVSISQAAVALWTVLQEPLDSIDEEPDLPTVVDRIRRKIDESV